MRPDWTGTTIGIALPAPLDAVAWSGAPAGLVSGLRAYGVEVVPLDASLPWLVERVGARLPLWRMEARLRGTLVARAAQRQPPDAIIMVGSFARPRVAAPFVTFEDMTVRQAIALGDSWASERPAAEIRAWERRQREIYAAAHAMCTLAPWAAESIVHDYGAPAGRVHIVGAGANHVVEPASRDWSTPRFLFIGREFERKNGPAVVRAFARLRAEQPDATLDVVGRHPRLNEPNVVGHGPLSLGDAAGRARLDALLRRATCFVMPSRYEPFGIAYVEAAFAGVPSIATGVGGAFVDDGCGRRVDPEDEDALLGAMRELSDGALAQALGERARERAAPFTWPLVAGRVLRSLAPALRRPVDGLPEHL